MSENRTHECPCGRVCSGPSAAAPVSLREDLANLAHRQWSGWMEHLFSKATTHVGGSVHIHSGDAERWKRQIKTPYVNLSEAEKDSDRKEADRVVEVLRSHSEAAA